jgi:2-polyprenyl-3-methyl-5-hydroxy-6-metoxy-1,4-benzoquinol methylase
LTAQIIPQNDLVVIGVPLERFMFPEFVENRDRVVARLGKHAAGLIEMKGHRVDRNRDALVLQFLRHPSKPDWLLFLDSDMSFPDDTAFRLASARKPVIGGLYFHRSLHTPFCMTEHKMLPDDYGRMRRSWKYERQLVFDFFKRANLPLWDSAVTIDGVQGRIQECDAVGTGCMLIHRSVLEKMTPPWFEYREMAESEDLTFCYRVRHELNLPVHVDLGTVCGHYSNVPMGHAQFRKSFARRGVAGTSYDVVTSAKWLVDFVGMSDAENKIINYDTGQLRELWNNRGGISDVEFYKQSGVGEAYLLDLIHWNESDMFQSFKNSLIGIEDKKVIVIGSGIGTIAMQLALQRNDVVAYEANDILREFSRKRWEWTLKNKTHSPVGEVSWNAEFGLGDGLNADGSIDLVVAIDVFEHMPAMELGDVIGYLSTLVKKGGRIFCHNNWGQQDIYPMHHDHSGIWEELTEIAGFFQMDDLWLIKVHPMTTTKSVYKKTREEAWENL